jgi:hypothetical protein
VTQVEADLEEETNTIDTMRRLETAVQDLNHFWVVNVDDLTSDDSLTIYAETEQVNGVLLFSQNSNVNINRDEAL